MSTPGHDRHTERIAAEREQGRVHDLAAHRRASRRSFLTGAVGVAGVVGGWRWLQTTATRDGIAAPLRAAHELNDRLWDTIGSTDRVAPEFPDARAQALVANGRGGLRSEIDLASWTMTVEAPDRTVLDELALDDVRSLGDGVHMVTEHKCIEGWSQIAAWDGVRFSALADRYAADAGSWTHVFLETPDGEYYVGLDRASALHPQTLLAYALGGQPLTLDHGAPLRLYTPNHYGIKSLKRIGRVRFMTERAPDFWAERQYDYHSRF